CLAPREERLLLSARCDLPLGFCWQPDCATVRLGPPRAVRDGVEPAHADDRKIGLREFWMRPVARQLVSGGDDEPLVLRACDGTDRELEWIDEDAMWRPLVL